MARLEIVEFLKGYAIFTIIIFHFLQALHLPGPYDQFIFFGGTGVHLFLLMSGFGLYLSYLKRPLPYGAYLKKRISKIYIPYILVVIISATLSLFVPLYENSWYALGGHVFLYKMFNESIMGSYGFPLWFISTILQLYIVFYGLAFIAKRLSNLQFLILCTVVSMIWIAIVILIGKEPERVWNSFFLRYLWEFGLGMVIASRIAQGDFQPGSRIKTIHYLIIGIFNCALYAFLALKGGGIGKMTNDIPALIGYSCIAIWVYRLNLDSINKFFIFTGKISFSLYLLHFMILYLLLFLLDALPVPAILIAALMVTYLVAVFYQKVIDGLYKFMKI
ncbi:MAG: acyltransferase [Cyclobacteriaceae bacterium]